MRKFAEGFAYLYSECITVWAKAMLGYVFFLLTVGLAFGLILIVLGLFGYVVGN
jgi:hypothetical protein